MDNVSHLLCYDTVFAEQLTLFLRRVAALKFFKDWGSIRPVSVPLSCLDSSSNLSLFYVLRSVERDAAVLNPIQRWVDIFDSFGCTPEDAARRFMKSEGLDFIPDNMKPFLLDFVLSASKQVHTRGESHIRSAVSSTKQSYCYFINNWIRGLKHGRFFEQLHGQWSWHLRWESPCRFSYLEPLPGTYPGVPYGSVVPKDHSFQRL